MKKVTIFDVKKNKHVLCGNIDGETFIKEVNPAKHYHRIRGGYCISKEVVDFLESKGNVRIIEIHEPRRILAISVNKARCFFPFDDGHGEQICLKESECSIRDRDQIEMFESEVIK